MTYCVDLLIAITAKTKGSSIISEIKTSISDFIEAVKVPNYLLAFGLFQMQTVSLMGREIGIVWTSIIYHITETAGLLILSLYLTKRYKGL